ncbi:MAG: hypothetical protein U1F43_00145 [Myxococcota bacterium]
MRRLILACATASLSACTDPPPAASTATSLAMPARAPEARVPLVPVRLATQADYDALEARWSERRGAAELIDTLKALAAAQTPPDLLLLQRIAVLVSDDIGRDRSALDAALEAGTKLRDRAPDDPHTLWFNGWVLWKFLTVGDVLAVDDPSARDLANATIQQWKSLLAKAPDYVGPRKHDAAHVRAAIARIEAALAEPAAPASAAGPMRAAAGPEIEALALLARYAASPDGTRRGICRDWAEREPVANPSSAELRVTLACDTLGGSADDALVTIGRLRQLDGTAFDACTALARLAERTEKADLDKALAAHPLGVSCP